MVITNLKGKKKSKKKLIIGVCVVLVVLLIVGPMILGNMKDDNSGYLEVTSSKETIETYYTFSGNVESAKTQTVMADHILQIEKIHVNEGDKVTLDTVLFTTTEGKKIKSGMEGTVNKIEVDTDQQVMSGACLAEIIDFDHLEINVKIDEYDLEAVSVDKKIEVIIGSLDKQLEGTISNISRTDTNQNGVTYFLATVKLNPDDAIKVGMTAEARLLNNQSVDVITIPVSALSFDNENTPFVYLTDERGNKNKTIVTTGITDGKLVEIKKGIENNQTVYYKNPDAKQSSGSGFLPPMGN